MLLGFKGEVAKIIMGSVRSFSILIPLKESALGLLGFGSHGQVESSPPNLRAKLGMGTISSAEDVLHLCAVSSPTVCFGMVPLPLCLGKEDYNLRY